MATISGVILDVSGSMKSKIGGGVNEEGGPWARSIFQVIDDLIKHDLSSANKVFAVGVGTKSAKRIIDVISTIKKASAGGGSDDTRQATDSTIESILQILESNGARTVRKWAAKQTISESMSEKIATCILNNLKEDKEFIKKVVNECLPPACRDVIQPSPDNKSSGMLNEFSGMVCVRSQRETLSFKSIGQGFFNLADDIFASVVSTFKQATVEDVKAAVAKALLVELSTESIFSIQEAHKVLHGVVGDEQDLTAARSRELLKTIEPFIYDETPLHTSIKEATKLLVRSSSANDKVPRLLFILSDGDPTDKELDINDARGTLKRENAKVVCCYISNKYTIEPRRLYSSPQYGWEDGAKFLFDLSSTIPTELVTRTIFIKRGWKMDNDNNETRLFLHVNHPDHLREACDLARNIVCCQDALSELLVSVDLDIYINQKNASIKAHAQVGGTCYANASAAVLHLAMHRILGRHKFDFETFRDEMISRYGIEGADTFQVLQQICPQYRLRCKKVDFLGAMKAIAEKRPVVARFRLTNNEWNTFGRFFERNPNGILKKKDLDISMRNWSSETSGHAVVLTSYNSECLRLMNSWGENWGEKGFFKVEKAEVLGLLFIDVYWEESDLTADERSSYRAHGSEVARKLMSLLKGLQVATFTCPKCSQSSLVTEFRGTLSHAICPRCSHVFSSNDGNGNILALNVHLTSLSSA